MTRIKHLGLVAAVTTSLLFSAVAVSGTAAAQTRTLPGTTTTTVTTCTPNKDGKTYMCCTTTINPDGSQSPGGCTTKLAATRATPGPVATAGSFGEVGH
jgi:hypothetical protein